MGTLILKCVKMYAFADVEILQQQAIIRMTSSRTAAVCPRSQYFSKAIIVKGCILDTKLL